MPDTQAGSGSARSRRIRAWTGALLFAVAIFGAAHLALDAMRVRVASAAAQAVAPAPLPVRALRLRIEPGFAWTERFVGRVEPARQAALGFERPGLVVAVLAQEGDTVAAGALLASLDTEPLQRERARLEAARDVLAADLALAESTLGRRSALSGRGFDTAQALDEARFAVDAVLARIRETDARLAAIDLDIAKSELRAPFAGAVVSRARDEGAVVAAGAPIVTLHETGRPRARVGVPAALAATLTADTELMIDTRTGPIGGRLRAVVPDIDPATRTRALVVDLPSDAALAMGEIVRLALPRSENEPGAWVPLVALQEGIRGLWAVMLVVPDGQQGHVARPEAVEVLHVENGSAFVRGAIPDGALLVAEGVHRLVAGQRVTPLPADGG